MTPVTVFAGQTVAVFGLGGSGSSPRRRSSPAARSVDAWDDNEHAREKARGAGLTIEDLAAADWRVSPRSCSRPACR